MAVDLSKRVDPAALEEWMDGPCSYEEFRDCLRDLARVNRLTLAYRPVLEWLERVTASLRDGLGRERPLKIVDVGSGYGDALRRIERWAAERGIAVSLVGVDLNANAVRAAKEATAAGSGIRWVKGDVYTCAEAAEADVVICSLMTHHLRDAEIVRFLAWMQATARVGWFVCDLHRKPVPYYLFGALTGLPGWHRFIRHDGLVSFRRSFLQEDWERLCAAAGVIEAKVEERRPARLCVWGGRGL